MGESLVSTAVDKVPVIVGCEVASTALRVTDGLSSDEWVDALGRLGPLARGIGWWVGDLLVYGEERFGDGSYADAAKALRRPVASLRQSAYVSRNVRPEVRVEGLPYRAHRAVASLSPDEQRRWLRTAEAEGWTSDELDERVRAARVAALPTGQNAGLDAAKHWGAAGMPAYVPTPKPYKIVVNCETEADLDDALTRLGSPTVQNRNGRTVSVCRPDRPKDDMKAVKFT